MTLDWFPESLKKQVILVVNHDDDDYRKHLETVKMVMFLPKEIQKVSPVRRYIMHFAADAGYDKIAMLDDDLKFYIRRDPDDWHLKYCVESELQQMFDDVENKLSERYPMVGVSPREGNNWQKNHWGYNCRLIRFMAFNIPTVMRIAQFKTDEDGLYTMEDFDFILQLLEQGYEIASYFRYAQGQTQTQAPGGCSTWRTHDNHADSAKKLSEIHDYVTLVEKKNKTGGAFGKRLEVRVGWKDTYLSGLRELREQAYNLGVERRRELESYIR